MYNRSLTTPNIFFMFIATRYIYNIIAVFFVLLTFIFLIDLVDIFRRASYKEHIGTDVIITLAFLKIGQSVNEILPFCLLFAVLQTYWRMQGFFELPALQVSGLSKFQILYPCMCISAFAAIIYATALTPIFAHMDKNYQSRVNQLFGQQNATISLLGDELWLREQQPSGQGYTILHSKNPTKQGTELLAPDIYLLNNNNQIITYIKAHKAVLRDKYWQIKDAQIFYQNNDIETKKEHKIATVLQQNTITGSLLGPGALSFWRLFSYIDTIKKAGFSADSYIVRLHYLLSLPLTFIAMTLIGAGFAFKNGPRNRNILDLFIGVIAGFVLYFIYKFLYAFSQANDIPPILAAWIPAFISLLIGIWMILYLEEQ